MVSAFHLQTFVQALQGKPLLSRRSRRWASFTLLTSSILIISAAAVISYWLVRQIIVDNSKTNTLLTVEKAGDDIDQWLATRIAEVETLANQVAIRSMHLEAVIPFLSLEADRLPDYRFLMYAYPDGSHYRTDQGFVQDQKILNSPYFKRAIAGHVSISGLVSAAPGEPQQISIAAPVWSVPPLRRPISQERAEIRAENLYAFGLPDDPHQKPKPIGALIGVIPIKHIAEVVDSIPKAPGSDAFVLDAQGMAIAHPNSTRVSPNSSLLKTTDPAWKPIYQTMTRQGRGMQRVKLGDQWVYVAYVPLRQANWSLALVVPKYQVETQLDALNALASVVAGVLAIASLIGFQQIRLLEQSEDRSAELIKTNLKLQQEVKERQRAESDLRHAQAELEDRVAARTVELETANRVLQASETQLKQQAEQLAQTLQELQQAQSQLIQTEKMSSLGQLIAGVAHEINNPVNFIYANLPYADQYLHDLIQLLKAYQAHYPNPDPEVQAKVEEIELDFLIEDLSKLLESMHVGTERIRQLVLSLRNFSRLDEAVIKAVDIHEGLENTLLILQNRLKAKPDYPGVQVIRDYNNPYLVECYPGPLNQVFMNILVNAIDALEASGERHEGLGEARGTGAEASGAELGTLAQSAGASFTSKESAMWQSPPVPRASRLAPTIWIRTVAQGTDWVEIRIADNGLGMAEEILRKVFDPFFTTKPVGKGTGIGLSISYQIIVEKHGGQLRCDSTLGNGAEFVIRIPTHQPNGKELAADIDRPAGRFR